MSFAALPTNHHDVKVYSSMNKHQRELLSRTARQLADNAKLQIGQLMMGYAFALGQGVETFPIDY